MERETRSLAQEARRQWHTHSGGTPNEQQFVFGALQTIREELTELLYSARRICMAMERMDKRAGQKKRQERERLDHFAALAMHALMTGAHNGSMSAAEIAACAARQAHAMMDELKRGEA
jgi:hypothetical protein